MEGKCRHSPTFPPSGIRGKEGTGEPGQGGPRSAFTPTGNEPWRFRTGSAHPHPHAPGDSLGIPHPINQSLLLRVFEGRSQESKGLLRVGKLGNEVPEGERLPQRKKQQEATGS